MFSLNFTLPCCFSFPLRQTLEDDTLLEIPAFPFGTKCIHKFGPKPDRVSLNLYSPTEIAGTFYSFRKFTKDIRENFRVEDRDNLCTIYLLRWYSVFIATLPKLTELLPVMGSLLTTAIDMTTTITELR